jgi:hypothetical protein
MGMKFLRSVIRENKEGHNVSEIIAEEIVYRCLQKLDMKRLFVWAYCMIGYK